MNFKPVSSNHYGSYAGVEYTNLLKSAVEPLLALLGKKKLAKLLDGKLQMARVEFDENQYIQSACEVTVISSFYKAYPEGFRYEPKLRPPKDVDFSFLYGGNRFNVEIKCLSLKKNASVENSIVVSGPALTDVAYDGIANNHPNHVMQRNRLLNLNDFLESARDKFPEKKDKVINLLMVCCYDVMDFADVMTSVGGAYGVSFGFNKSAELAHLLKQEKNLDVDELKDIDGVVVTNLGYMHKAAVTENKYMNPWDYNFCFAMGLQLHQGHALMEDDQLGYDFKKIFRLFNDSYRERFNKDEHPFDYFDVLPNFIKQLNSEGRHLFLQDEATP